MKRKESARNNKKGKSPSGEKRDNRRSSEQNDQKELRLKGKVDRAKKASPQTRRAGRS